MTAISPAAGSRFSEQVAVVTGAGRGIGAAIATRLVAEGARVALCDVDERGVQELASRLGGPDTALALTVDVASVEQVDRAVDAARAHFGPAHLLFNNAGIAGGSPIGSITGEQFDHFMHVNVFGMIAATQAVLPAMRAAGAGKVVNTCSVAGKAVYPGHSLYAATKFAVRAFTIGFARELAAAGITVNAVCPGHIDTPLWDSLATSETARTGAPVSRAQILAMVCADVPLGRPGTSQDVAALALYLASPDADYITGQCVNVDGGLITQ